MARFLCTPFFKSGRGAVQAKRASGNLNPIAHTLTHKREANGITTALLCFTSF